MGWRGGRPDTGTSAYRFRAGIERLFDLERAAESQAYCDEVKGIAARHGLAVTELSTHLQGQLVASHPAFDTLLDAFAPPNLAGDAKAKPAWAVQQLQWAAKASRNLGLTRACNVFGRAGVAVFLSVAAAAGGTDRRGIQGIGAALAADSERIR